MASGGVRGYASCSSSRESAQSDAHSPSHSKRKTKNTLHHLHATRNSSAAAMASTLKELDEEASMTSFESMTTLNLAPSKPKHSRSPNIRRHFSEGGINLANLNLDKSKSDSPPTTNGPEQCFFNISTFSNDDPIKFAEELQTIVDSIKTKKDLPPRYIMLGLMDALQFWINTHGVPTLSKLKESTEKMDSLKNRHEEAISMYKHMIEELSRQSRHDEQVHIKKLKESEQHDEELTSKLTAATQQLQQAALLEQQIFELQQDLESKSNEIARKTNTAIAQQKMINQLKAEKMQNIKLLDSLKVKASRGSQLESEVKGQQIEIRKLEQQRNELESKYAATCTERDDLIDEKILIKRTVSDYAKLRDNLVEYQANEQDYLQRIDTLTEQNMELHDELRRMKEDRRNRINEVIQREIGDNVSSCPQTVDCNNSNMSNMMGEVDGPQTPLMYKRTPIGTPIPSRGSTPKFVRFNDEVHTYNTSEEVSYANSRKMSIASRSSVFDEREFEEFKMGSKYPMSELDTLSEWSHGRNGTKTTNSGKKERNEDENKDKNRRWGSAFGFKTMYRSLAIVTVGCLAYVLFSRYQQRVVNPPKHLREAMTRNIEREIKTY